MKKLDTMESLFLKWALLFYYFIYFYDSVVR
jgi:hypothetical protein